LVERFEEKAALQHPIFKPVDLPEFQIGDDIGSLPAKRTALRSARRSAAS
jgi:hypothetical protein